MAELPPRFEVIKTLGQGAMGKVLLARDRELGRQVAIKVLLGGMGAGEELARRFSREARIMSLVEHPHLIRVLDFDTRADPPFVVMEVVEGGSLTDWVRNHGAMTLEAVRRLVRELGGALDAIHAKGIIHRDLKPGNVMLRARDGSAVLMDLGLASYSEFTLITQTGQVLGTPRYLPPEVVLGGNWSGRGDLYQLGAVAFEALTGIYMVQAQSFSDLPTVIAEGRWAPFPDAIGPLPDYVADAIRRMTSVDPQARFDSAAQFAEALATGAVSSPAPSRATPRSKNPAAPLSGLVGARNAGGSGGSLALSRMSSAGPGAPAPSARKFPIPPLAWAGLGFLALALALGTLVPGRSGPPEEGSSSGEGVGADAPLEHSTRLAAGRRVRVVATRSCQVHWTADPGAVLALEPGERYLTVPPGSPRPWTLEWSDGERRGEVLFDPTRVAQPALDAMVDAAREDPTPHYLDGPRAKAHPEVRQPFAEVLEWIPDMLADPGHSLASRGALFTAFERAARSVAQERLLSFPAEVLELPVGALGAHSMGEPAWLNARSQTLPFEIQGGRYDGNKLGVELAVAAGRALMGGAFEKAADSLLVRWPELSPPPRERICLLLDLYRLPPGLQVRVRSKSPDSPFPAVHFWHPAAAREGLKFKGWLSVALPADLAPRPGEELLVQVFPLLAEQDSRVRLTGLKLLAE